MANSTQNHRRDQNVASIEAAREGARQMADVTRQASETTQETIRTAVDTASRAFQGSAAQFARAFGITAEQEQDLARQSTRNLEAITECSAILMRGFQEITREAEPGAAPGSAQHGTCSGPRRVSERARRRCRSDRTRSRQLPRDGRE